MNYIISALIGIVVWQVICIIVYLLSHDKDEVLVWVTLFVPAVIITFLGFVYRKIHLEWCRKHLNRYAACYIQDEKENCNMYFYMNKAFEKRFYHEGQNNYYIKMIKSGATFKSAPNKSEIYHGEDCFQGWDMRLFLWRNNYDKRNEV